MGDTCPLCLALDGKVMRANSAEAKRFTPPLHINCDCILTEVGDDEVGAVDWLTPPDQDGLADLVEQHGHFVSNPDKYVALKIPAGPTGRDFTLRRTKDGEPNILEWHRPRYPLPGLDPSTVQSGVAKVGAKWRPLGLEPPDTEPPGSGGAGGGPRSGGPRVNLVGLKGHLTVTHARDEAVREQLDDLALVPSGMLENLASEGVHIYVGAGDVTGLDQNDDLVDVRPADAPEGVTYTTRYGIYRRDRREITIGTGSGLSHSRALH